MEGHPGRDEGSHQWLGAGGELYKWWSRISDWGKKGIDTSVKLLHMATFPCVKLSLSLVSSVLLHCLLVVYHSTDCLTDQSFLNAIAPCYVPLLMITLWPRPLL